MRTVLHLVSRSAVRALRAALSERGHEVLVETGEDAPRWDPAAWPDLLVVEVPAGPEGAARCLRLWDRTATRTLHSYDLPYVLAVVAPGGGEDALAAGADNFIAGVDGELGAHLALAEQAIDRRRKRSAAEAALVERLWELHAVADHERDLIAIIRAEGGLHYGFANRSLADALGTRAASLVGTTTEEQDLPFGEAVGWYERLKDAVATGEQSSVEFEVRDEKGAHRYSAVILPELGPDGHGVDEVLVIISEKTGPEAGVDTPARKLPQAVNAVAVQSEVLGNRL